MSMDWKANERGDAPAGDKNRVSAALIIWIVIAVVAIIFIAQNAQRVEVQFLFVDTTTPLIFALLIATLLGIVIGYVFPLVRRRRGE